MKIDINIIKRLNNFNLDIKLNINFDDDNRIVGLLGASGCGKSATLKCLCGIYDADYGNICVDGDVIFDKKSGINISAQNRKIGYLFQNYALFPHMNVLDNLLISLKLKDRLYIKKNYKDMSNNDEIIIKFRNYIKLLGIEDKLNIFPKKLSGGESQRVALARLLISNPRLIILDEPFSAIDSYMKEKLQVEFIRLIRKTGIPAIIVSHNREEVYRMCDYVNIINEGVIVEQGYTKDIFSYPVTKIGAIITGCKNVYELEFIDDKIYVKELDTYIDKERLLYFTNSDNIDIKKIKYIGIRAHDLSLSKTDDSVAVFKLNNAHILDDQFEDVIYANNIWFKCKKNIIDINNLPKELYVPYSKLMLLNY